MAKAYIRPINISDVLPSTDRFYPYVVKWEEALGGAEVKQKKRRFNNDRLARRFRRKLIKTRNINRKECNAQPQQAPQVG